MIQRSILNAMQSQQAPEFISSMVFIVHYAWNILQKWSFWEPFGLVKWNGSVEGNKTNWKMIQDETYKVSRIRIWWNSFTDCSTKLWASFAVWEKILNRVSLQLMRNNSKIIESQSCKFHWKKKGHETRKIYTQVLESRNKNTREKITGTTIFCNNIIYGRSKDLIQIEYVRSGHRKRNLL